MATAANLKQLDGQSAKKFIFRCRKRNLTKENCRQVVQKPAVLLTGMFI
jgi:hypothetical protein